MSAHHAPDWVPQREGTGIKHNGIFATWLALCSFTFFLATFVAANVYLRGWSPEKFNVDFGAQADLPGYTTLVLIVAGLLSIIAGNFWRSGQLGKFKGAMVLVTLAFFVYVVMQIWLIAYTWYLGAAAWTIYLGVYVCQILLTFVCIGFIISIAKYFGDRNEKQLRSLVPAAMSVFLYTVVVGVACLVITDVITVGEFAEWCGTKLQQISQ
jgi:uncharacterized membrane protein YozB (DUF420 family)